jgi:hypothetical protein
VTRGAPGISCTCTQEDLAQRRYKGSTSWTEGNGAAERCALQAATRLRMQYSKSGVCLALANGSTSLMFCIKDIIYSIRKLF